MILTLGGNGFIGYNFVKRFAKKEKIRVFDRTINQESKENIEFVEGDFRYADFDNLLDDIDSVFHFISSIVPFDGTDRIIEDIETNIIPTLKLLESMKKKNVKKIFFVSSGGTVYGECEDPVGENAKLSPECVYAAQKICLENYLYLYEKYDNIQSYILRISNPYGLEMKKEKKQGIIPIFTQRILLNEPIEVWGTGKNKRDYIYIDEVIDAIESVYQYKGDCRIFNIGTGKSYSILDIIRVIEKETGKHANIQYMKERKCDLKNSILDTSLINRECGWRSNLTIERGIKDYIYKLSNKL
jgi:UDP-glucose 4-epimerase